jgi:hypothetical protein
MLHKDFWLAADFPEFVKRDAENRPHCETGPFCRWRDGVGLYFWHGTEVPATWIENKASVDVSLALTWPNIEQRKCLAEIIGWDKVLAKLSPRVIDQDADPEIGQLVEVELPDAGKARFIRVRCGTGRQFAICVPNEIRTAAEGGAWTYGIDTKNYRPEVRT